MLGMTLAAKPSRYDPTGDDHPAVLIVSNRDVLYRE
jgi:hypothetical protein